MSDPIVPGKIHGHQPLQRFEIKMFQRKYVLDPQQDLRLTASSVGEEAQTQHAKYAFYATVRDMAETKVDSLEAELEAWAAELDQQIRVQGVLPNGAKVTDESAKHAIRNDTHYKEIKAAIVEARGEHRQLCSIVRAFEQRKDMIAILATRQNTGVWQDRDVEVTVAARVYKLMDSVRNAGQHPSKLQ